VSAVTAIPRTWADTATLKVFSTVHPGRLIAARLLTGVPLTAPNVPPA
jgi:hypothetical protein